MTKIMDDIKLYLKLRYNFYAISISITDSHY